MHIYDNPDKDQWIKKSDVMTDKGIRRSCRGMIIAQPHSGKSTLLKYMISSSMPPYDEIYISCNVKSKEYQDIDYISFEINDYPNLELDTNKKILFIFEDCNNINALQKKAIEPLFSYDCSHHGYSAIILTQTVYDIPICIRRLCDLFIIFSSSDVSFFNRLPIHRYKKDILSSYIKQNKKHDYIKIDLCLDKYYKNENEILLD